MSYKSIIFLKITSVVLYIMPEKYKLHCLPRLCVGVFVWKKVQGK